MKLVHEEIKEILPDYLRSSLTEEIMADIKSHLKVCEECSSELSLVSELLKVDVPDAGELFWKTLPQKVRVVAGEERTTRFSLSSILFRPLPVASVVIILVLLLITYARREEPAEYDPSFKNPFTTLALDYSDVSENDISFITEHLIDEELYQQSDIFMEYSYYREFVYLNSEELDSLNKALKKEQNKGG